jgi:ubiquinone biosynthesis protein
VIKPSQVLRLLRINQVLLKHGLDEIVLATHLFRPFRFLMYLQPWNWFKGRPKGSRGERIRMALEELGPTFVKFGQLLSTRRDLFPSDIANELALLQDHVPPFPGWLARNIVEKALGESVTEAFKHFDETPLASASIAQVHAATLHDGTEVIVKVVRPHIKKIIRRDVALLYTIAGLAERYWPDAHRLHPVEIVAEYEKTIYDELDLMREAASCSTLRRNFTNSELLYVPEVYWEWCRREVMVMERISGMAVSDTEALTAAGVDLKKLAEAGVQIFFTQVFSHNFFHADMHPGNIFVSPEGQYIAVDFGIMGSLSPEDQRYLAENFFAFFQRDYRRVAELHVESGWVPADTRVNEFESAIRTVSEPIFERPLKDISFGRLLVNLFQTARRFDMEVQPQLVLLQKTLLNIEGLGRQLYPDLDLWTTAKPFFERWMKDQLGWGKAINELETQVPKWGEVLPQLPGLIHDVLKHRRHGVELQQAEQLEQLRRQINENNIRSQFVIPGAALIIGATVIYGLDGLAPLIWAGAPLASWILGGVGVSMILAAWSRNRE